MAARSRQSWIGQILFFLILAFIFSLLPFVLGLLLDKSSVGLALFTTWYALIPPIFFLLLGWLLYRQEAHWLLFVGRAWIGVGLWFLVQYLLRLALELSPVVIPLTIPSILVNHEGVVSGIVIFLVGGIVLSFLGSSIADTAIDTRRRILFWWSSIIFLILILVVLPSFVLLVSHLSVNPVSGAGIPSEDEIFSWIEDVYNLGPRRPGSPADLKAIEYLKNKLSEFGFSEIKVEPYTFDYWEPESWSLTVQTQNKKLGPLACFYVPYSGPTGPNGLSAEMVYAGQGSEEELTAVNVAGKVILVEIPPVTISWDQMKLFTFMAYDPEGTAKGWSHPYPVGWMQKYVAIYKQAVKRNVAGIVSVLKGYPDMGEFTYYAPYDGKIRSIPGLYIRENDGKWLKSLLSKGKVKAHMQLQARVARGGGRTATVYGVLPGRSQTNLIIHSHHDAPWQSGVEDSSGVGMVLSLAKYFAQVPLEKRKRTLIFMFTGSHMVGAPSNKAFMANHRDDIMARMLYDIAIEHIADDYNPPAAPTGLAEPRGIFLTENPILVSQYAKVIVRYNIYRALLFPTDTPLGVPTDAGPWHQAGYRIVSYISGPSWLFDKQDTLDRVARDQLVPLTRMYIDFIFQMDKLNDALLTFNLNVWTIVLIVVLLTPLTVLSSATGGRRRRH
ncbi:MAG: M28 family peptidase [Deltaproteobacteria bacterium]|nr:M28 family peptidase [Deltaproteobacteria bacterium]